MYKVRTFTIILILLTIVGLVSWDIYAYMTEDNSSISVVITDMYYTHPFISMVCIFTMGALAGHWFVPAKGTRDK